ncbi:ATP-binding protein [Salinimicrobium marinum]|uniref:ATP-binding protein n=1 Tax=Salinimicrobium marinum TaxID=680283 RepID=A0A918SCD0_9FLAO|nr:ATP-binding protein [Salinimicrobium marinum]GHA34084.1 ATP-binding protein [Salinimicrobium marinum]
MRYLNKIIFINSAAAHYAEISLDGNVHLIGTQGVGKSTLLRAILFFYNADKMKLGIPREKKNFDQYYFPYQNSYIIYEVKREDITYSIIAFKSQGRVAFRFFDARYDKNYFIDDTGKAYPTFEQTTAFGREVYYTKIISNYEDYRNILYGNNKGLATEFRKYALLESRQYQNIPRTIQNVFLNSKLDAAFIKETIIKSLSEEEIKIDLSTYAHNHLRNFETELNDIKIWSQKNKAGKIIVRSQAEAVATANRSYLFVEQEKKSSSTQLGWFLYSVQSTKPEIEEELEKATVAETKAGDRLNALRANFEKNQKQLQTNIGIISSQLKELKEKKKVYEDKSIETILSRAERKSGLIFNKKNLQEERKLLTGKFEAIEQQYRARLDQLETQLEKFKNKITRERLEHQESFGTYKENLQEKYENLIAQIEKQHHEAIKLAENEIQDKDYSLQELKIKEVKIKHTPLFKSETKALEEEKKDLEQQIITAKATIENSGKEKDHLKKEWELENAKAENGSKAILDDLERSLQETSKKIETVKRKIDDSKGSFYEWLNTNLPNWESSIGKVVDEENVLFSKDLSPQLSEGNSDSFYGVQLDLSAIDKQVRTLEDYEEKIQELSEEAEKLQSRKKEALENQEKAKENLKRRFRPKINSLKEQISSNSYHKEQFSQKLTKTENSLHELEQKAAAEKTEALEKLQEDWKNLAAKKQDTKDALDKLLTRVKREVSAKNKEKKDLLLQEETNLKHLLKDLKEQVTNKEKEIASRTKEIKAQEKSEFNKQGADTGRIEEIDKNLGEIGLELDLIESNNILVIEYHKDKRELFDKEPDLRNRRSLLNKELERTEAEYRSKENNLLEDLKNKTEQVKELKNQLRQILQDLEKYEDFRKLDWFPEIEKLLNQFNEKDKTALSGSKLIENITEKHYSGIEKLRTLQEAITRFAGNFAEENIFNFPTRFNSTNNYLNFAEDLREFLEEDKIAEYEARVNERFSHIIRQIGKETGEMLSKEGEINRVIQKINSDFKYRNFVGAIKSMAMRTVESSNKIMKILLEIKAFNDENGMQLGETNLFSSDDQNSSNAQAVKLLKQLLKEINLFKADELKLSDSFGLEFRIVENDNDSQWVEKLSNVGSEGTDVLVKAMINIMLLNVFKDNASKKFKDFKLHCMMDEIGRLHPNNVKGILKFANDRNILLINGSPTSYNATEYRYTYILSKNSKNFTTVKRLVQKIPAAKSL